MNIDSSQSSKISAVHKSNNKNKICYGFGGKVCVCSAIVFVAVVYIVLFLTRVLREYLMGS